MCAHFSQTLQKYRKMNEDWRMNEFNCLMLQTFVLLLVYVCGMSVDFPRISRNVCGFSANSEKSTQDVRKLENEKTHLFSAPDFCFGLAKCLRDICGFFANFTKCVRILRKLCGISARCMKMEEWTNSIVRCSRLLFFSWWMFAGCLRIFRKFCGICADFSRTLQYSRKMCEDWRIREFICLVLQTVVLVSRNVCEISADFLQIPWNVRRFPAISAEFPQDVWKLKNERI